MTGWIKISKDIVNHWLWNDAERLKWWLDILMLAAWEDRQTLVGKRLVDVKRGQLIASLSYLCARWKRSRNMVEPFLNMLIEEKMITKDVANNIAIITVTNYERYQANEKNSGAYLSANNGSHLGSHLKADEQSISANSGSHIGAHLGSHLGATNKEYKEYNNNIINNARTREEEIFDKMKGDTIWRETIAMRHHLTLDKVDEWMGAFWLDSACNDTQHRNLRDAKSHFNNWLRIQLKYNNQSNNDGTTQQQSKRRSTDIGATCPQDYAARF